MHDPNHIINWDVIQVEHEGELLVESVAILNRKMTMLRNRTIRQVKVQWRHLGIDETTWELEEVMQETYPFLLNKKALGMVLL